jgi:hypothetical protein
MPVLGGGHLTRFAWMFLSEKGEKVRLAVEEIFGGFSMFQH